MASSLSLFGCTRWVSPRFCLPSAKSLFYPLATICARSAVYAALLPLWLCFSSISQAALEDRSVHPAAQINPARPFLQLDITALGARLLSVGEHGRILFSDDQGLSWTQAKVPVSVLLTAIDGATEAAAWAVGHDGILLKTLDRGETWQLALDGAAINQLVADYYQVLLAQAESDSGSSEEMLDELRFRAEDALIAQQDKMLRTLLDVAFIDADRGYVLGAYGLILATQDGGQSWQPMIEELGNLDGLHLNAITFTDTAILIAGEAGALFRRQFGDDAWEVLDSPYQGSFFGAQALGGDRLLVFGLRGHAFISDDGGDSWESLSLPLNRTLTGVAQLSDGTLVFVGSFAAALVKPPSQPFRMQRLPIPAPSMSIVAVTDDRVVLVGLAGAQTLVITSVSPPGLSAKPLDAQQGN